MRGLRTSAAAVAAAGLAFGGTWGSGALAAGVADEERVFRQEALAHGEAIGAAYRRLEQHILMESTGLTSSWANDTPPLSTGWLGGWTDRGVRARYCDETLLVYLAPAELKGVGEDHRSVHAAPHAFVSGGGDARFPQLHWLDGGVAQGGGIKPDVRLPPCMTAGLPPSGRAALAGEVKDPFALIHQRDGVEYEFQDPQPCGDGEHGPGRRHVRKITWEENARGEEVPGSRVVGDWEEVVDACRADYSEWEYFTQSCADMQGQAPHDALNPDLEGEIIMRRLKTVTADGTEYGEGQVVDVRGTCWDVQVGDTVTPVINEVRDPQSMTVACGQGYTGSRRYTRTVITRSTKFPWDDAPVVTVRGLQWRLASSSCEEEAIGQPPACDPAVEDCDGTAECDVNVAGDCEGSGGVEEDVCAEAGTYSFDVDETRTRQCSQADSSLTGTYVETRTVRYEYELREDCTRSQAVQVGAGVWWMSVDNCEPVEDPPPDQTFNPPGPPGTPGSGQCGPPGDGSASPSDGPCTGMDASIANAVANATGSGGGGSGGGGCYLTTAVVEHRGIEADDGPTLTALRSFRDTYMMETPVRRALVRLYYRLAPGIARDLERGSPAWDEIGRHIDSAVEALESGDRGKAFRAYWAASVRAFSLWAAFKVKRALA